MSDTPDVIDALTQLIGKAIYGRWEAESLHSDSDAEVDAYVALTALTEHGYVVVKADGLQHGDELVQVEINITGEIGTQAAWMRADLSPRTETTIPENGDNHD